MKKATAGAPTRFALPALYAALCALGVVLSLLDEPRPSAGRPYALAGPTFRHPESAQTLAQALRRADPPRPAYVVATDDPLAGRRYRVQIGAWSGPEGAEAVAAGLDQGPTLRGWETSNHRDYAAQIAGARAAGPPDPFPLPRMPDYLPAGNLLGAMPLPPGFELEALAWVEHIAVPDAAQRRRHLHAPWFGLPAGVDLEAVTAELASVAVATLRDITRDQRFVVLVGAGQLDAAALATRLPLHAGAGAAPLEGGGPRAIRSALYKRKDLRPPALANAKGKAKKKGARQGKRRRDPTPTPTPAPTVAPTPKPTFELIPLGWEAIATDRSGGVTLLLLADASATDAGAAYLRASSTHPRNLLDDGVVRWHLALLPAQAYPGDRLVAFAMRAVAPVAGEAVGRYSRDDAHPEETEDTEGGLDAQAWGPAFRGYYRTVAGFASGEKGAAAGRANWSAVIRPLATPDSAARAYQDVVLGRRERAIREVLEKRLKTRAKMGFSQVEVAGREGAGYFDEYYIAERQELYFQTDRFVVAVRSYPDEGEPFPFEDLRDIAESLRVF